LIEFTEQQSFSFQASTDLSDYVDEQSIQSKIATLAITFPSLRLLWSRSPHCTTDIFKAIMAGHEEVDEDKAIMCGASKSEGAGVDEDEARITARDMLLKLPGINENNLRSVIDGCENLADLASRSEIDLQSMIGRVNGHTLYKFLTQEMPI
jgi:DNA excision repair protein ERCC-4